LYYHSMSKNNGVVGLAKVSKTAFPDTTADEGDWSAIELKFVKKFSNPVTLAQIKATPALKEMKLLKIGRLSVSPVTEKEFDTIMSMAK
jgi:predicted RNA-binding protein with PUA-like domain